MAETLKFGPEWLRALSDGNSVTSPPPSPGFPKYKLAEHRYGREEMLALYVPNKHIPEEVYAFPYILHEKPLDPMAYIPSSEEEQRMMSQSVNSAAVLRMAGRGSSNGGSTSIRGGGRGPVSERGRGRGRGRGDPYSRGSQDEPGEPGYGRGRSFSRSESWEETRGDKRYERGYSGRGPDNENGPVSPRRDYSRSMSDNWRCAKEEKRGAGDSIEDDDGGDWRRAGPKSHDKWGTRNWRDRGGRSSLDERGSYHREDRSYQRQRSSSSYDDDIDADGLPEWSMPDADDLDGVGTFDSSGAFMSMKDAKAFEEEKVERKRKDSKESGGGSDEKEKNSNNSLNGAINKSDSERIPDNRPSSDKPPSKGSVKSDAAGCESEVSTVKTDKTAEKSKSKPREETNVNNNNSDSDTSCVNAESVQIPGDLGTAVQNGQTEVLPPQETMTPIPADRKPLPEKKNTAEPVLSSVGAPPAVQSNTKPEHKHVEVEANFDHLEKATEEMVANWIAEEDAKSDGKAKVETGSLPWDHEDAKRWFYKDPQGELQGPFSSNEMAEWFSAGYFTMNLLVKRGCDDRFQPLGEIIKRWGRVPFLAGPSPPPLHTPVSQAISVANDSVLSTVQQPQQQQLQPPQQAGQTPAMDPQLKLYHPFILQQQFVQQMYIRQLQLLQQVQQNDRFAKLTAQQQQQLVLQLLMKQQEQPNVQQLQGMTQPGQQPPGQLPQQQPPPQQKISPRSTPDQANHTNFQNSSPDLATMVNNSWAGNNLASSGTWTQQTSVWDLPADSAAKQQAMEEFARLEKDQEDQSHRDIDTRAKKQEEEEERKRQDEMQRQQQEELKRQEEIRRQQEELHRQEEVRRQQEMERQRQIEIQQEEEARRRREEEERRRRDEEEMLRREEELRRQEMEQRQREMEQQKEVERQMEIERETQRQKEMEMERKLQDDMRRKEIEIEVQRQQEIQRRQEMQKHQEIYRQQQEAMRRLQQQQQLAQIQLPSSAQWANQSATGTQPTNTLSLAQIQQFQEEKERKEREEQQRQLELQRQHMHVFQQQQQPKKWGGSTNSVMSAPSQTKSLMEIQEEQARQLEKEKQAKQQSKNQVPLATAAVWSGTTNSSHWAQEGAWGQAAKQQGLGFWDDNIKTSNNKTKLGVQNNQPFPSLKVNNTANNQMSNKKSIKVQREEENVQRLFQANVPNDEFNQWCESALRGMHTSVDIPTFITFLLEVDSPYEVHDYVRSYLGETHDASSFARMFIEKRSKVRNQVRHQPEDSMWGPARAVNPNLNRIGLPSGGECENRTVSNGAAKKKELLKKKKMQKVDSSILGFTVHAAPDRVNVGEIELCD